VASAKPPKVPGGSIADRVSGSQLLELLKSALNPKPSEYVALVAHDFDKSPFAVLVATVLSQNTNDKNSIAAYLKLRSKVGASLKAVLEASEEGLAEAIRVSGLARRKAKTIKSLAKKVAELGGEEALLTMDARKLREELLSVSGVGPKTVDVFLSLYRREPFFAVDTHAARIAARWGLVAERASYDEISKKLLELFGGEYAEEAHRLLIALGRKYCKARKPLCSECPVAKYCPSYEASAAGRS